MIRTTLIAAGAALLLPGTVTADVITQSRAKATLYDVTNSDPYFRSDPVKAAAFICGVDRTLYVGFSGQSQLDAATFTSRMTSAINDPNVMEGIRRCADNSEPLVQAVRVKLSAMFSQVTSQPIRASELAVPAVATSGKGFGNWEFASSTDPMTDQQLKAVGVSTSTSSNTAGTLVFMCQSSGEGAISFGITTDVYLQRSDDIFNGGMHYRVDSRPAEYLLAGYADTAVYPYLHATGIVDQLARSLANGNRLLVRLRNSRHEDIDLEFDIYGVNEALAAISNACGDSLGSVATTPAAR